MENKSKKISSERFKRLIKDYDRHLDSLGIEKIERGTRLQHARWMCTAVASFDDEFKINRWLGFIQAWLVAENIYSLDDCMNHSRDGTTGRRFPEEADGESVWCMALDSYVGKRYYDKYVCAEAIIKSSSAAIDLLNEIVRQCLDEEEIRYLMKSIPDHVSENEFLESCSNQCHCESSYQVPCPGVMAGGCCDDMRSEPESEDDCECTEPPCQADGSIKCATCGRGFPESPLSSGDSYPLPPSASDAIEFLAQSLQGVIKDELAKRSIRGAIVSCKGGIGSLAVGTALIGARSIDVTIRMGTLDERINVYFVSSVAVAFTHPQRARSLLVNLTADAMTDPGSAALILAEKIPEVLHWIF